MLWIFDSTNSFTFFEFKASSGQIQTLKWNSSPSNYLDECKRLVVKVILFHINRKIINDS